MTTAEHLRRLARSSPWRWRTVRFSFQLDDISGRSRRGRAWVRRPDGLRVEDPGGRLLAASLVPSHQRGRGWTIDAEGRRRPHPPEFGPLDSLAPPPVVDAEGLVVARPSAPRLRYDDPMYSSYVWVAMLDPVELADGYEYGSDGGARPSDAPPLSVGDVRVVSHGGREAWEADVEPTDAYGPRCSCCPLLFGRRSELLEHGELRPDVTFAERWRIRLDVATGICVRVEELPTPVTALRHEVLIEAVDEPQPDVLFAERPSRS